MLQSLHIQDLALLESAELELGPGLNVLSGETGGGKSLLVTALKLLRGERATAGLVRRGASCLRVDGEFSLGDGERSRRVGELLQQLAAVELDGDVLVVTRIVDAKGRSKVRLNGRPTTLGALRELGGWLLEIHGQGDSRALMRPEIQCEAFDAFAGTTALRGGFASALVAARRAHAVFEEASGKERERLARVEFLRFQLSEMEQLGLEEGEIDRLEGEHCLLAHLDRLRELLDDAIGALQDREGSALELIAGAGRAIAEAAEIDPPLVVTSAALSDVEVGLADAARDVQSAIGRLDLDPARLAAVDERLTEVRRALERFGPTEADFRANLAEVADELRSLEDSAATPEALREAASAALARATATARKLLGARRRACKRFAAAIEGELADLGMQSTRFAVAFEDGVEPDRLLADATAHGPGPFDFEVCVNAGEAMHSLRATASGGELARIVLAIKKSLADQDSVPFLVFDEIDAEIGGRLGLAVGRKLRAVAQNHQVVIVTHLPQVAAFAQRHFHAAKAAVGGRTVTTIRCLEQDQVEHELAAMSVGDGADVQAIREARRLVAKATRAVG